jgi:hypothetical protein
MINFKILNYQLQYFIHWWSYDVNEHTWKLTKHFSNSKENMKFMDAYPMPRCLTLIAPTNLKYFFVFRVRMK